MAPYQTRCSRSIRAETSKPGIPSPPAFAVWIVKVDMQIHPLSLGRQFEFLVVSNVFEIGADEDLCHIPIPQFVRFCGHLRVWLQIELLVGTDEQQVEIALRPTQAYLGTIGATRAG
jgi:hypothetical protein